MEGNSLLSSGHLQTIIVNVVLAVSIVKSGSMIQVSCILLSCRTSLVRSLVKYVISPMRTYQKFWMMKIVIVKVLVA